MGGYGSSIQTVVSNNKKLRRERKFLNNPNSESKSKLKFDKVSEEKLHQIKLAIQEKAKKERKSSLIAVILFVTCLLSLLYLVVVGF
ncbi:hypothetical protein EV195_10450 [Tenacibaculum skagerrakense]|uniref:Uncharacterized protein n=1 Tax=Tenacibaculum skagerrakense TaxID=186571 RepID=A0A4R2NSS2_9FLAO|nr:hypothetical protein [Tenacibaculum skagerrakense]TCP25019.1 hypothetical protein EV195_10450 [Tenacibaculum skagerrakense]